MISDASKIPSATWRSVPATGWTLGFVSLLMDVSSELIHSLLPVFLTSVVGASAVDVGLIEGIAEATAAIAKVFSGAFSDRIGKRKAPGRHRLGSSRLPQADIPARKHGLGSSGRAVHRSHRQGHPRRAPRRPDRRHHSLGRPRRGLWHPSGARYGRRVCGAAVGGGPDGALCRQFSRGVLVGAVARGPRGAADRDRRARAGWHSRLAATRLAGS